MRRPAVHDVMGFVAAVLIAWVVDIHAALPGLGFLALFGTALGLLPGACNPPSPWWRKPDLLTDVGYFVVLPPLMHYGRVLLLMGGCAVFYGATTAAAAAAVLRDGCGPLAALPLAGQFAVYLAGSELALYAVHRWFHRPRFWRFHAVHHSSEHLEWISAHRVHPVDLFCHGVAGDCVLLLLGISPAVLVWLVPLSLGMGALVHANLDWDFGPFRYLLASPVFHRWHHTGVDEGGGANFASNFPVLDIVFGTFYLPRRRLPAAYGVTERDVPPDIGGQLMHPFRRKGYFANSAQCPSAIGRNASAAGMVATKS